MSLNYWNKYVGRYGGGPTPMQRRIKAEGHRNYLRYQKKNRIGKYRRRGNYGRYNKSGTWQELKFHDVNVTVDPISVSGSIHDSINKIAQGATELERIGRKVIVKSIHIKGKIQTKNTNVTDNGQTIVRIIVFLDKQCNGAIASVLDLLESTTWDSFRSLDNSGRFKFLLDRTVVCSAQMNIVPTGDVPQAAGTNKVFRFNTKCAIPVIFSGATGAITEMCCNNIGILTICDKAGTAPFHDFTCRLRFQG